MLCVRPACHLLCPPMELWRGPLSRSSQVQPYCQWVAYGVGVYTGLGVSTSCKATGCPGRLPKSCSASLPSTRGAMDIREEALLQVAQQHIGYSFTGGPSPRAASGSLGAGRVETYDQRRSFTENASYLKTHFAW